MMKATDPSRPRALAWSKNVTAALRGPRRFLEAQTERKLREMGLRPIEEPHPDDIFIVGYPRSGHTWMQNLIAGLAYGVDPRFAPDTVIQELVPDIHFKACYQRYGTPTFFKSHLMPRPEYRRVVYLLRDGRDATVSYFHFLSLAESEVDFMELVTEGKALFPYCKWHDHVDAWLANPYNAEMIVIRYEDLLEDPLPELRRLSEFAGIEAPDELINTVVASSSFKNLKAKEAKGGMANEQVPRGAFMRRGEVGSFRDEMPPEVLEAFLQQSEGTLRETGYLPTVTSGNNSSTGGMGVLFASTLVADCFWSLSGLVT